MEEGASIEEKPPKPEVNICLVCGSKVNFHQMENAKAYHSQLLNNLRVIFILRHLLKVPKGQLERNLEECGNPENWIRLCDNCSELTRKGEELCLKIMKIDKELRSIRNIIVNKIRSDIHDDNGRFEKNRREIWRRTRDFVTNYVYQDSKNVDNPFEEGDKRAEILVNQLQKSISSLILGNHSISDDDLSACIKLESEELVEPDDKQWNVDEDDDDWEPEPFRKIGSKKLPSTRSRFRTRRNRRSIIIDGKHKCRHCDKLFKGRQMCIKHEQMIHPSIPGQFPCDLCGQPKNSLSLLREHKWTTHKIKMDGTPAFVNKRIRKRSKLPQTKKRKPKPPSATDGPWRKLEQGENNKWKCIHCDKEYTSKWGCYSHVINKHERTGQFICDICGKISNNERHLYLHKRGIHHVGAYGTPINTKTPPKPEPKVPRNLKSKVPKKTKLPKKPKIKGPQTCEICGKIYASQISLHNHKRYVHEKRLQCWCHLCAMGFYSSPALERHLLCMHQDDEEIKRRMEGGARIWRCGIVGCPPKFEKEKGFKDHRKNVHGNCGDDKEGDDNEAIKVKKYTCSFCRKGFWMKSKMRMHELIHINKEEKPFSCDIRGVRMATVDYLRNHRRRVHKISKKN